MYAEFKAQTLAHCLFLAQTDTFYARWAASEYERQMPWLLTNLRAKVEWEIAKSREAARDSK